MAVEEEPRKPGFFSELKRRKVYQAGAIYVGGALVLWGATDNAVEALGLPPVLFTLVVAGSIVVLPVVLVLAWYYDLERDDGDWAPSSRPFSRRQLVLGGVALAVVASAVLITRWRQPPVADDEGNVLIAVYPFATVALEENPLGQGVAELVTIGLDGMPGLTALSPNTLWPPILEASLVPLRLGDDELERTNERFGVDNYVTGTLVQAGSSVDVGVRLFDRSGEELALFRTSGSVDSLTYIVDEIILDLIPELWEEEQLPELPSVRSLSTSVPDALQSYLEAMAQYRTGNFVAARDAIELAVQRDSTFALAHLAHYRILSWLSFLGGRRQFVPPEPLEAAERHQERLSLRHQWYVAAHLALGRTDALVAASNLERIQEVDAADVDALRLLADVLLVHGWQTGAGRTDAYDVYDRVLQLEPESLPTLYSRATNAIVSGDDVRAASLLARMEAVDPQSPLTVDIRSTVAIASTVDEQLDSVMREHLDRDLQTAFAVLMRLRIRDADRAEAWARILRDEAPDLAHQATGRGALAQLLLARGALGDLESLLTEDASAFQATTRMTLLRGILGATMIGNGNQESARAAATELKQVAPVGTLMERFADGDSWAAAWSVASYEATVGDTVEAKAYGRVLRQLPAGGPENPWPAALATDVDARLAVRRGDAVEALALAQSAYDMWVLHDAAAGEWYPEPAIRFHLAELLEQADRDEEAAAIYGSFVYNVWTGYYTPLAAVRLGELLTSRDPSEAAVAFRVAVAHWEGGDPAVVGEGLEAAREGLAAIR